VSSANRFPHRVRLDIPRAGDTEYAAQTATSLLTRREETLSFDPWFTAMPGQARHIPFGPVFDREAEAWAGFRGAD